MKITQNVVNANFILMFSSLLIYEFILLVCLIVLFSSQIFHLDNDIIPIINDTNKELLVSFNNIIHQDLQVYQNDAILIGRHLSILDNSAPLGNINTASSFYTSIEKCIVEDIDKFIDLQQNEAHKKYLDELLSSKDKMKNPINTLIKNTKFFNEDISSMDKETVSKILTDTVISLDMISHYSDVNSPELTNTKRICFTQIILKTILIKNILQRQQDIPLNNFFIIEGNHLFQYPLNKLNKEYLTFFKEFECSSDVNSYSVECLRIKLDDISQKIPHEVDSNYAFPIITKDYYLWGCFKMKSSILNNPSPPSATPQYIYICSQNNIYYNKEIKMPDDDKSEIFIIKSTNENADVKSYFSIYLSIPRTLANSENYFTSTNLPLLYRNSKEDPYLFHFLYYELFEFMHATFDATAINVLITEYNNITNLIYEGIKQIKDKKINEFSLIFDKTYLNYDYDLSGKLDKKKSKKDIDCFFLMLRPLKQQNFQYNEKFIHENKDENKYEYTYLYAISIYKMITKKRKRQLFDLFVYKAVYTLSFSIFFLLICNIPYLFLFQCFLEQIFMPINEISKKMKLKITNIKNSKENEGAIEENQDTQFDIAINDYSNQEYKEFIQFFLLLENIMIMKKGNTQNIIINEKVMNEIYPSLKINRHKIIYGTFIAGYFFKNSKYAECRETIKNIKQVLEEEMMSLKEENENIDLELNNLFDNFPYINDWSDLTEIFNNEGSSPNKYYFELCLISIKLYSIYGICKFVLANDDIQNSKMRQTKILTREQEYQKTNQNTLQNINGQIVISYNENVFDNNTKPSAEILERLSADIQSNEIRCAHAIPYFEKARELCKAFRCNKMKIIMISIYISKCYLVLGKFTEAEIHLKDAFFYLIDFNREIMTNPNENMRNLDPILIIIMNNALFEEIIYLLSETSIKENCLTKQIMKQLSYVMTLSIYKTDFVQSNVAALLSQIPINNKDKDKAIIKKNQPLLNLKALAKKIQYRLSTSINEYVKKQIFLLISPEFAHNLPSIIEIGELLGSCIKNYCSPSDIIYYFIFDQKCTRTEAKDFSKENIYTLLYNDKDIRKDIPRDKYGMEKAFYKVFEYIPMPKNKEKEEEEEEQEEEQEQEEEYEEEEEEVFDNYIFQFILTDDYRYKTENSKEKLRNTINTLQISLYSFIFDFEITKEEKQNRIKYNMTKYIEGIAFNVRNFSILKSAFHNISNNPSKKNIFNVNPNITKNFFYKTHLQVKKKKK